MNPTIVINTAIQRALSPARVLLVFSIATFPALVLAFAPQLGVQMLQSGALLGIILGAGLIGQDVSAGVVQLLFARPVSRAEYVLSRWFAAGACATAVVLIQVILGGIAMAARGVAPSLGGLAGVALEQSLAAFGIVGVIALLSSFLPGVGDIMALLALNLGAGVTQMVGGIVRQAWLVRAGTESVAFLNPTLDLYGAVGGGVVAWLPLVSYFSTVTLCLGLAIVILNRRELSYATD